ncbi:MAG: hypothetical protein WAM75_16005, partial [Xanthobacteraceae bacterium]
MPQARWQLGDGNWRVATGGAVQPLAVKLRDYRRLAPVGKLAQITLETSNASVPPGWTAEQFAMKS